MHFPYTVSQSCTYFPSKGSLLFHMQISVPNVKLVVNITRFIRPACLIDSYINHTLTVKTSSPSSPPRTTISGPNSVTDPYYFIPNSLSQLIFCKIDAGNVALSCFL
ncbi:hypothetical protein T12_16921 [Trichinella patagoniensis]|uniref:Uncharacterized protein n=1 Tax=Trichinella patagoniensis TaxID=990121 RepID=A0A0V0Z2K3_9BILA|nr:hypothetical protein T12_14187 [Trichinella patagoniensis]KRY06745.1 hypothetical protein T12_16921 [Trichinella patagoniensis]